MYYYNSGDHLLYFYNLTLVHCRYLHLYAHYQAPPQEAHNFRAPNTEAIQLSIRGFISTLPAPNIDQETGYLGLYLDLYLKLDCCYLNIYCCGKQLCLESNHLVVFSGFSYNCDYYTITRVANRFFHLCLHQGLDPILSQITSTLGSLLSLFRSSHIRSTRRSRNDPISCRI